MSGEGTWILPNSSYLCSALPGRLTVGQQILGLRVGVRILPGQQGEWRHPCQNICWFSLPLLR